MKPQVLHAEIPGGFLITVNGTLDQRETLRQIFDIELAKVVKPFKMKLDRTEVAFTGLADIGIKLEMYQVRCIAIYDLTSVTDGSTVAAT